ncbi:MAG: ATP-binding cassette domain-containing protein [Deltaproteobacteria bacterium]|nr:ATP-binding cassette domain-containing protein [Deltaproteobacteria bacterium]MBW2533121.1 ATP-binding cassette domain-containing protein [Deltaproteobacteria bacterium]
MIGITNLSKNFGEQTLFEDVTLQLNPACCYGVVGANGSGKSTFLKILTGDEYSSDGEITFPKAARIGVLRQDRFQSDDQIILDVAMMGDEEAWNALREQDELAEQEEPDADRMGEVDDLLNALDGYTLESRASEILLGVGVAESSLRQPLRTLSGGYKLRVLLAQVLVSRPDALFLDEPTNHLDILSIRWLESFLRSYKGCAVVVSHDHRFLNDVATHILDVDYSTITAYTGNYASFLEQKVATRERKEAEIAKVDKAIADKKAFIERFRAKATKARQAQSRAKQIERMEIQELPRTSRRYPKFRFEITRPPGKEVLDVRGLCKAYGENQVLDDVSLLVRREERVAVIGANGLGKSTLLKIATGNLEADAGEVAWGHETHVGYFAQDPKEVLTAPKQTALDYVWDACPEQGTGHVRGLLGRLLFTRDEVHKKIESVSGGEATRLVFGRLMVEKPNVLILDEPTNHLDLEAIEALLAALQAYEGTLIFVSHDRWFVSQLATRVIEVKEEGLTDFAGTYDEYVAKDGDDHLDVAQVELRAKRDQKAKKRVHVSRAQAKKNANRIKSLTKKRDDAMAHLETIEARLEAIQHRYCEPGFFEQTDPDEVEQLKVEETTLEREQAEVMARWEGLETELTELQEG